MDAAQRGTCPTAKSSVSRRTRPPPNYGCLRMSLLMLVKGCSVSPKPKEMVMELFAGVPDWLVWCAAGGAGAIALANIAVILEAVLELDAC
jgi:hypothetical protein